MLPNTNDVFHLKVELSLSPQKARANTFHFSKQKVILIIIISPLLQLRSLHYPSIISIVSIFYYLILKLRYLSQFLGTHLNKTQFSKMHQQESRKSKDAPNLLLHIPSVKS